MKNLILLILVPLLCSCANFKDDYTSLVDYGEFKQSVTYKEKDSTQSLKVSMRIGELALKDLLLGLSDEYNVPIVWSSSLDESVVSGYFQDIELETVLDTISRRINTNYININGVHYVGKLESSDLASAVFPMPAGGYDDVKDMLGSVIAGNGKMSLLGGQVVIRDNVDNIRRYSEIFNQLSKNVRKYLIELWFVNVRADILLNIGAELSLNAIDLLSGFNVEALFNLTASKLAVDSEYSNILQRPVLQVIEGCESSIKVGREVPLEQTSISSEGYVTTTGYEILSDGLDMIATVRRLLDDKLSLDLELEISTFEDISSTYPVKDTQTIKTSLLFKDSEVFLIGGYGRNSFSTAFTLLELLATGEDSVILIWGKIRELQ